MKFNQLVSFRRQFIKNNNTKDHVIINGDKKVLISHFIPDADKSVLYEECHVAGANFEFVSQGKIYTV